MSFVRIIKEVPECWDCQKQGTPYERQEGEGRKQHLPAGWGVFRYFGRMQALCPRCLHLFHSAKKAK